jgi:hypothetical protein
MIGTSNAGALRFLHRLPTGGSGGSDIYGSQVVNDGQWHYFTAVREGSNLTMYLDGEVAGTGTSSDQTDEPLYTVLGYFNRSDYRQFNGQLDELVILNSAANAEEVQYLMNSAWPAIDFEDQLVTFNAPAQSTVIASGLAQVSESVPSGWQQVDEQVNAVLQLATNVNVPIVDDNASALNAYLPFELEAPGDTVFDDITDLSDFTCLDNDAAHCPTIAYEGALGQSAYFDGIDDSIHATNEQDMGESFAFWVNVLDASNGG